MSTDSFSGIRPDLDSNTLHFAFFFLPILLKSAPILSKYYIVTLIIQYCLHGKLLKCNPTNLLLLKMKAGQVGIPVGLNQLILICNNVTKYFVK